MPTTIAIEGTDFLLNGRKTYLGRVHNGRRIEGLLMNSRMVQATFDDECPETRDQWRYPDTGDWDPDRNTVEFCAALPAYREHGLLAVTIGLQGGGPVYTQPTYDRYINTAFRPDGSLKDDYMARVQRVLDAADRAGMAVIVNYFYWRQERFENDVAILRAAENATGWLLATGHENLLVDLRNEITERDALLGSKRIHEVLDIVRSTSLNGRRLIVGTSTHPFKHLPEGRWPEFVDFFMPHGNDWYPDDWRKQLREFKNSEPMRNNPRPICCNEDSIHVPNLDAAIDEGCSWGYYDQGYGCGQHQAKHDWSAKPRETRYEDLSGFQTPPVNWTINDPHKRAFFARLKEITGA